MAQGSLQISNLSLKIFPPSEMRQFLSRIVVCGVLRSLHESRRRWLYFQMKFRRRRAKPLPGIQDQPIDRYSQ
ncbi:hypothetical protein GE21DRAFT_1313527 [Neurospora crassa]|nr:hypothetical protein GE21DRAFT_1313527 [Neurospora crassa]